LNDIALTPIVHGFAVLLKMLRNVVTPFSPVGAEMRAEATPPASTSLTILPC
jgi:hypothetical protein